MLGTVEIPVWLLVLVLGFAALAALDWVLVPSVRWFFRRRLERAVRKLNERLERPIEPFKLMERHDRILRLIYDPQVMEAVVDYARTEGVPETVAFEKARAYAREIVPGFSAIAYFSIATRLARWLSRALYHIRVGASNAVALQDIDPEATVVFVMNHRSNMDYVLLTHLSADRLTLSYAVGEWARVWPLQSLIRGMGGYFIRRRYQTPLYRRVLARYVQMATAEGVTQAIFPEGGLSLDGRVGPAKLGLLGHIVAGFRPGATRDVVFVPVALNYDRVLEDRMLLKARREGTRRFPVRMGAIGGFFLKRVWQRMTGRFQYLGNAEVRFGARLSLAEFARAHPDAPVAMLGEALMTRIRAAMPVLPVPLLAAALVQAPAGLTRPDLEARVARILARLEASGATHLPQGAPAVAEGLAALELRRIVVQQGDILRPGPGEGGLLAFYAASVLQLLDADAAFAAEPLTQYEVIAT